MTRLDPRPLVLVADDQPAMATALEELLTGWGYHVEIALSGRTAISAAAQMLPDLILMDIQMPGIGGIDAAAIIRQNRLQQDVPILFFGTHPDGGPALAKPVCPSVLRSQVAEILAPNVALPA